MSNYHLEDECWDEAWEKNQIEKVKKERMNILSEEYRRACKQEMMNDLIKKFNLLLVNENISDGNKERIYHIIMNVLSID